MSKQKLEQYLRDTLKKNICWFIKLQNSHFQPTPADFLVLGIDKRYLIECKQIKFENMRSSLSFDRLSQEAELLNFKRQNRLNESLILMMFWNKRLKNSYIYCIPIDDYMNIKSKLLLEGTKSINMDYLDQFCNQYKIETERGLLNIKIF